MNFGSTTRRLPILLTAGAAVLCASAPIAGAAGSGYLPTGVQTTLPKGFQSVAYAHSFGRHGETVSTSIHGVRVRIKMPERVTSKKVQIALAPSTKRKDPLPRVLRHWHPVVSMGLLVREGSTEVRLRTNFRLALHSPHIHRGDIVLLYNQRVHRFVRARHGSVKGHTAELTHLRKNAAILVVQR